MSFGGCSNYVAEIYIFFNSMLYIVPAAVFACIVDGIHNLTPVGRDIMYVNSAL